MPSLNITFTDEEHTALKAAAERRGVSLKTCVHDAAIAAVSEHKHRVLEAARIVADKSAELNRRLA